MRTIPGFYGVKCVGVGPAGVLYVVGRYAKEAGRRYAAAVGGTALWAVAPGEEVQRVGPVSPTYTSWLDVIDHGPRHRQGVAVRQSGFSVRQPTVPVPASYFHSRENNLRNCGNVLWEVWAGGDVFITRPQGTASTDLTCRPLQPGKAPVSYQLGGKSEHHTDSSGVTVLTRVVTELEPPRRVAGSYVVPGRQSVEWRIFHKTHDETPLGPHTTYPFSGDCLARPATGGIIVQSDWPPGRTCLVAPDRTVTVLDAAPAGNQVIDAAYGSPTLSLCRRADRSTVLALDHAVFEFTGRRSVVGARLSPDGLTVYLWTRTELVQFDL